MKEPLSPSTVKRLLVEILAKGRLAFTKHAYDEMDKDWELERGTWRYRVETQRMAAVVAFRAETHAVVVTAWRFKS